MLTKNQKLFIALAVVILVVVGAVSALVYVGVYNNKVREEQLALQALNEKIGLYPSDIPAYESALKELEKFLVTEPTNPSLLGIKAVAILNYASYVVDDDKVDPLLNEAQALITESLKYDPYNLYGLHAKFNYNSGLKSLKAETAVKETLTLLQEKYPEHLTVQTLQGRLANREGRYSEALQIAEKVLASNPLRSQQHVALLIKVFSLENQKDLVATESAYKELVQFSKSPWDYQSFAVFLIKNERFAEAIERMTEGLKIKHFDGGAVTLQEAHVKLGSELFAKKEYDKAFTQFNKAVVAYPFDCGCFHGPLIASYYRDYAKLTGNQKYLEVAKEVEEILGRNYIVKY